MGKIADPLITKEGANTESFYDFLISRYIAPHFTFFFKKRGVTNPNVVSLFSFVLILIPSAMVLIFPLIDSILYRIIIAVLVQVSFALDCSDGQLARITGKTSKLGAWLDKVFDRVGQFLVFVCFGILAWRQYGNVRFLYLGLVTGYGLALFTLLVSLFDSLRFDDLDLTKVATHRKSGDQEPDAADGSSKGKRKAVFSVLSKVFFFLNFGIGERYLYLSFFIILNRVDIMLYISTFLTMLRVLGISHFIYKKLKKLDGMRIKDEETKIR